MTVSCALRGTGEVAPATRERVLRAAHELGYRPNASARAIRAGRFGCAAMVLSSVGQGRSNVPQQILQGAADALQQHDMHLTIASLPDEKLTSEGFVPKILREWMADGLLILYNARIPEAMIELIRKSGHPSVWVNSKQSADCVYPDDYSAARDATSHLLAAGHRRILYLDYSISGVEGPWHYSGVDRFEGYAEAMRQAGLTPARRGQADLPDDVDLMADMRELLSGPDRPTAAMCYTGRDASNLAYAAAASGLQVPRDLSIACVVGERLRDFALVFSAMLLPEYEMGRQAVELLREKIAAPRRELPPAALPCIWWAGDTITSPPDNPGA